MITDAFHPDSPAVFGPGDLYSKCACPAERCVITFSQAVVRHALESFPCEVIAVLNTLNGERPVYSLDYRGERLAFYMSPITAAGAGTALEEAVYVTGIKHALVFGSCGALDRGLSEGRLIVPDRAYRDEGLSYHYAPAAEAIEVKNAGKVSAVLDSLRVPYLKGPVWTTDALYRETRARVEKRKAQGCVAVDMECSGLQALCDFHGIEYYTFFYTGDQLDAPEWDARILGNQGERHHMLSNFIIALEIMSRL